MVGTSWGATRVLWVGPFPPPLHGASNITLRYCELVERTHKVKRLETQGPASRLLYPAGRVIAHCRALAEIPRKTDRLYLSVAGGLGLLLQLPLPALARILGKPVILHHHSYSYINRDSRSIRLLCLMAGPGAKHIFLSQSMRDRFERRYGLPARATRVVSNACFVERSERLAPRDCSRLNLIHVSNLSSAKGSGRAVDVWEEIVSRGYDANLTLIGGCREQALEARLLSLVRSKPDRFHWLGECNREMIADELDKAHYFIFPSEYVNEAEPLVVLEALSRGVPAISTARGALKEVLPSRWLSQDSTTQEISDVLEGAFGTDMWDSQACDALACFDERVVLSDDPLECVVK